MRALVLCVLLAATAACSSSTPAGLHTEAADQAFRDGDYERAYDLYAERLKGRPGDPLIREKMDIAWARARGAKALSAEEAARQIRESNALVARGDRMLADGRPVEALNAYRAAQEYVPGMPEARQGEVRAEEEITKRAVARAQAAEAKGEVGRALGEMAEARAAIGEPFDPQTDPLSVADRELRARVAAALKERALAESEAGRPAVAGHLALAWAEVTGRPLDEESGWFDAIRDRLQGEVARRVFLEGVEDGTDGRVDTGSFLDDLERAYSEGAGAGRLIALTGEKEGAALTLTVKMDVLEVNTSEPSTQRTLKEFVVQTEALANPELERLRKTRDRLQEDLRLAEDVAYDARREYDVVRRLEGDAEIRARYTRLYGHYSAAAFYRHLANARVRDAKAKRRVDQLKDALDDVLERIGATDPIVHRETRARATVTETTQTKSARAIASFRLAPAREGVPFTAIASGASVEREVTDSGWPGLPDSGVPEEPLSLPSDAQMADLVLTELAGRLAEEILAKAMSIRRATYEEGMRLEKEGLFEDALDRYAAFVLMAGDAFPLEARVAGDKIERRWGLAIAEDGSIDISNLRLD